MTVSFSIKTSASRREIPSCRARNLLSRSGDLPVSCGVFIVVSPRFLRVIAQFFVMLARLFVGFLQTACQIVHCLLVLVRTLLAKKCWRTLPAVRTELLAAAIAWTVMRRLGLAAFRLARLLAELECSALELWLLRSFVLLVLAVRVRLGGR